MVQTYFSGMLPDFSDRSKFSAISMLGFTNQPLRKYLLESFSDPFGSNGKSFLADPTFEAVFGWSPAKKSMGELEGRLLTKELLDSLERPPQELVEEYSFPRTRIPYSHQLQAWEQLSAEPPKSLVVTSGTGSGKTECFMIPILDKLVREYISTKKQLVGVEALFLYPLNALINSQKDRLRAWTEAFGSNIRFCLYNGDTPERKPSGKNNPPSEVGDRHTLRSLPPPILVTNTTMLEYMLVRNQDADILSASKGKLKWIVLDEAHTYIGSQAAELSLLIRRVIHAFGVEPANVRFIATSATIGDPNGASGKQLKEFLAEVAGVDASQVNLVSGNRKIPRLPEFAQRKLLSQNIGDLEKIDSSLEAFSPKRFDAVSKNRTARAIRSLFTDTNRKSSIAKLSEICQVVFRHSAPYSRMEQQEILRWLDFLSIAGKNRETPFLPLRAHLFHRVLPGLWACINKNCPERTGTALDHKDWAYGGVYLQKRFKCKCGAPVFELFSCDGCSEVFLKADRRNSDGLFVHSSSIFTVEDDFELNLESDEDDILDIPTQEDKGKSTVAILNKFVDESEKIFVEGYPAKQVCESKENSFEIIVNEQFDIPNNCPYCHASNRTGKLFRNGGVGPQFILNRLLPSLLEYAPNGNEPARHPYLGRRLLTFSDSRQNTARLAAHLQQNAERTKVRSYIYHTLLENSQTHSSEDKEELCKKIKENEELILKHPEFATLLSDNLGALKVKLASLDVPNFVTFEKLARTIGQKQGDITRIHQVYNGYSRDLFGGSSGLQNVASLMIYKEFARRPKRQPSLESMGMVSVVYPKMQEIKSVPDYWKERKVNLKDYRDFLKILLDYFVRSGGSSDIPTDFYNWLGFRFHSNFLVPSSRDKDSINSSHRRWPSSKTSNRWRRLLCIGLGISYEGTLGADAVELLLKECWNTLCDIGLLRPTGEGYQLKWEDVAFSIVRKAWVCPVTNRLLDTTFKGFTPYFPNAEVKDPERYLCTESVDFPIYPHPFGVSGNAIESIQLARKWLEEQNNQISVLRERGLWSNLNDNILEFAPLYKVAEHSAQQDSKLLQKYESEFKNGDINMLSCSTTMEMGIDIGGIQMVAMNNVPPHPANYLQRTGRAGRRQETRSVSMTLCRNNPHDQNAFSKTNWAFESEIPPPRVSLESSVIVQRHINALVLSYYLKSYLISNDKSQEKLDCDWFFLSTAGTPKHEDFVSWCHAFDSVRPEMAAMSKGIRDLCKKSIFDGRHPQSLVAETAKAILDTYARFHKEWASLDEQEKGLGQVSENDPALKAIRYRKRRLEKERLLKYLTTEGFLPIHGFPTNIAVFDNLTVEQAKKLRAESQVEGRREDNNFIKRDLASRDISTAIREYAPGAEIVIDGLVYKSSGIVLNWQIPATVDDVNEIQNLRYAWRCDKCGSCGTTSSRARAMVCDSCGATVNYRHDYLDPAGFAVDFYSTPSNDVSTQQYIPMQPSWIAARGEWNFLSNPNLGRYRASSNGTVYHHSAGINNTGYALCLRCGRAEPMKADGQMPDVFSNYRNHNKLRSKKEDRVCSGSNNEWAIRRNLHFGHELLTDILEIQLKDIHGNWIENHSIALTMAVAIRNALAEILGIDSRELGADVVLAAVSFDNKKKEIPSIVIYDRQSAGYATAGARLLDQVFRKAISNLDCPVNCEKGCSHCIIDYDQRFVADDIDRRAALQVWTSEWLNQMSLSDEYQYFGEFSTLETTNIHQALLREGNRAETDSVRLFGTVSNIDSQISFARLSSTINRLLKFDKKVELLFDQKTWDIFTNDEMVTLYRISAQDGLTIASIKEAPTVKGVPLIAEIEQGGKISGWASDTADFCALTHNWGNTSKPLIRGNYDKPIPIAEYKIVNSEDLLPSFQAGDIDLPLQSELDGYVKYFGDALWQIVTDKHEGIRKLFNDSTLSITYIRYSDRYLHTPLSLTMILELVSSLKAKVGMNRWGRNCAGPIIEISTEVQSEKKRNDQTPQCVFHNWPDSSTRDRVAEGIFDYHGLVAKVMSTRRSLHARNFEIEFSNGEYATIRFDEGISYWWLDNSDAYFNFYEEEASQIMYVADDMMNLRIAGRREYETYMVLKTRQPVRS